MILLSPLSEHNSVGDILIYNVSVSKSLKIIFSKIESFLQTLETTIKIKHGIFSNCNNIIRCDVILHYFW